MSEKLTAISLFSGAGGMDVGFAKSNFDILFANDIDRAACETYNLNHTTKIKHGDLRSYFEELKDHKGINVVFGGPPCQGFSVAGKMDPNDDRSQLIWSFFDAVEVTKPDVFVCENVKALAVNKRWHAVRDGLIERAEALGYNTTLIVLKASDFGVPQARERMFLIGIKKTRKKISSSELSEAINLCLAKKHRKPQTIRQLVKKLGPQGNPNNMRKCSAVITFAKNPILRKSPYAGMLFNGAGRPINPDGVALTLAASMGGNKTPIIDESEVFKNMDSYIEKYHQSLMNGREPKEGIAPKRLRRITVDEALAIQSFPKKYKLSGSQSSMYKQIGNAVPCKLAEAVGKTVHEILDLTVPHFIEAHRST